MSALGMKLEAADFTKLQILLIDDNKFIRLLIKEILRTFGVATVLEAETADHAMKLIIDKRPDIVICDWLMRPVDGMGILKMLRAHSSKEVRKTPFIMLSGEVRDDYVAEAIGEGADSYIAKPFTAATLMAHLVKVILKEDREEYFID
jgi:two-component system chemotaxis response regulator CheY